MNLKNLSTIYVSECYIIMYGSILDFLVEFQNLSYVVLHEIYLNSTLLKEHNYDNDGKYKLTRKKNRKNVKSLSITKMYILCKVKKKK